MPMSNGATCLAAGYASGQFPGNPCAKLLSSPAHIPRMIRLGVGHSQFNTIVKIATQPNGIVSSANAAAGGAPLGTLASSGRLFRQQFAFSDGHRCNGPLHGQQRYQQQQQQQPPVFITAAAAQTFRQEYLMMRTNQHAAAAEPSKGNPNIRCPVSQHYAQPKTMMTSNDFSLSKKRGKYKGKFKQATAVERRNARERTRVHTVNQAFVLLRRKLPSLAKNTKRVSKLKILRAGIARIDQLLRMLDHEVMPPFGFGTDLRNNDWSNNSKESSVDRWEEQSH
uniref:BHLH domain-containing protein n=1 Tax=Globodera rostochiensis TaxID=31243 RepID=A0A914ICK0_GLORO